jgi:hypothetical protein
MTRTVGLRYGSKSARAEKSVRTPPEVTRVQTPTKPGATFKMVSTNRHVHLVVVTDHRRLALSLSQCLSAEPKPTTVKWTSVVHSVLVLSMNTQKHAQKSKSLSI